MFVLVNGVRISEIKKSYGDAFENMVFELIYEDQDYLKQRIDVDFLQVNVKGIGSMWIYAIKNITSADYRQKRKLYGAAVAEVHARIVPYLKESCGYKDKYVLIDRADNIFT